MNNNIIWVDLVRYRTCVGPKVPVWVWLTEIKGRCDFHNLFTETPWRWRYSCPYIKINAAITYKSTLYSSLGVIITLLSLYVCSWITCFGELIRCWGTDAHMRPSRSHSNRVWFDNAGSELLNTCHGATCPVGSLLALTTTNSNRCLCQYRPFTLNKFSQQTPQRRSTIIGLFTLYMLWQITWWWHSQILPPATTNCLTYLCDSPADTFL